MKALFTYSEQQQTNSEYTRTIDGEIFTESTLLEDDAPNVPNNKWDDWKLVKVVENVPTINGRIDYEHEDMVGKVKIEKIIVKVFGS